MSAPSCCRPVLVVEGDGDLEAVPLLLRRWFPVVGAPGCFPATNPIRCGDLPKIRRPGQLERFVELACSREDGDSVVLLVDSEDDCPKDVVAELTQRVAEIAERYRKKVGIALMYREYETLFLFGLPELAEKFTHADWALEDVDFDKDWESVRAAKGQVNRLLGKNYFYKETRDQARMTDALDIEAVTSRCRSALHLDRVLRWLNEEGSDEWVYPALGS